MKKLGEMSKEEIAALTDEEINTIIDLKLAEAGMPLLGHAPVAPVAPKIGPDKVVYYIDNMIFRTLEDAAKIRDIAAEMDLVYYKYLPGPGYNRMCIERTDDLNIQLASVYSEDHWDKIKDIKTRYDNEKANYDSEKAEYDNAKADRAEIVNGVWDVVDRAISDIQRIRNFRKKFEEYLKLAEGNRVTAYNFLRNTYPAVGDYSFLKAEFLDGLDSEG